MAKNENCAAGGSSLCKWMSKDCSVCQIASYKSADDVKKALGDFEVTLSLLPEDFDELQGEECQLCKGEKGTRAKYALVNLGHEEPKSEVGMFFGFGKKVRRKIGSLMPLSVSVCKRCMAAFRTAELIKWGITAAITALAIIVLTATPLSATLAQGYSIIAVIALALIGYAAGRIIAQSYIKAKSKEVRFNVFEIPICAEMKDLGWFAVQDDTPVTRYIFSRKPMTKRISGIKENAEPFGD
jgi:hypothetical protein